jgi:copper chaperone CopZ
MAGGLLLIIATIAAFLALRGQASHGHKEATPAPQEVTTVTIRIDGPACCSYCENSIDVALAKLNGIIQTRTDYEVGWTQVKYDKEKVTLHAISETITGRGYKILSYIP